jgi:hypothetical protein
MGLKSSSDFLAVSGRGAANLVVSGNDERLADIVGGFAGTSVNNVEASGPIVEVRDFGVRSPMIYSASKLRQLSYIREEAEELSLGDIDVSIL